MSNNRWLLPLHSFVCFICLIIQPHFSFFYPDDYYSVIFSSVLFALLSNYSFFCFIPTIIRSRFVCFILTIFPSCSRLFYLHYHSIFPFFVLPYPLSFQPIVCFILTLTSSLLRLFYPYYYPRFLPFVHFTLSTWVYRLLYCRMSEI